MLRHSCRKILTSCRLSLAIPPLGYKDALRHIKPSALAVPDGIPPILLKMIRPNVLPSLFAKYQHPPKNLALLESWQQFLVGT